MSHRRKPARAERPRFRRLSMPVMAALAGILVSTPSAAQTGATGLRQTSGVFVDRAGKQHVWSISTSHTLIWDGAAYVPVGGIFMPRYLAESATEENWAKDVAALKRIKEKGLADLIVDPVVSAPDVPAAAWQRFLDHLESEGFRYGISFGQGIKTPVSGWLVKPPNYRVDDIRDNVDVTWNVQDADSGYYVFVDRLDSAQIAHEGQIKVRDGMATVQGRGGLTNGLVGLFYPHKAIRPTRERTLPDVWSAFDAYRDRLLTTFSAVKFGPGLRFFLDPLTHRLGVPDEADALVPDSAGFRLEWEAYLTVRYPAVDDLMTAWGVTDRTIKDFKQAARLVALYSNGRGTIFMLDPETNKRFETRGLDRFWSDLREARNESLVYYMNTTAELLKRELANVPVVYTRTHHHRIFSNTLRSGGYDGLGIAAYGGGSRVATTGADSVYSQVNEAGHPMWCVVTETMDSSSSGRNEVGYASKETMHLGLGWLRDIGAKGFFVNGFQVLPEAPNARYQLASAPDQLDWLRAYRERLDTRVAASPHVLPFPSVAASIVRSGPIGNGGVWWVPSLASGKVLGFGSSYAGYTISLPKAEAGSGTPFEGEVTVLWSLKGPRQTRLLVGDPRLVKISAADGMPLQVKSDLKKKMVTLMMDENPIVISRGDTEILPLEAVQDVFAELRALIKQAEDEKHPASTFRLALDRAQSNFDHNEPRVAFIQAVSALSGIVNMLQPYAWLEGERPDTHTFSEVTHAPAASGEAFLSINGDSRPGTSGYGATYKFTVPADDEYTVWLAGTPPGANASPFVWLVDTGQPRFSSDAALVGSPYMSNQFGWLNLGKVSLAKGGHSLTLRVTDVAPASNKHAFAVDALLITRGAFAPNGTVRPTLVSDEELKAKPEKKKGAAARRSGK